MNIKELIYFYSRISDENYVDDFPITYKFSEKHVASGEYYELAKLFDSYAETLTKDDYDLKFYNYLKSLEFTDKYVFDDDFVAHINVFSPFIDSEKKIISQKWHLLIAVYAYLDVVNNKMQWKESKIYKNKKINYREEIRGSRYQWKLIESQGYSCGLLKLWMAEAAGVNNLERYIHEGRQIEIPWNMLEEQIKLKMIKKEIF